MPLKNKSGNVRTLFLMQYHLAMSHLVPQLKLVCPLDVMCEWEEMLWGPLRRNTVNTCNKARGTACVNALLRTQTRRRLKEEYGKREEFSEAAYRDSGPLPTQYRASGFEAEDREDLVLDSDELANANFPALVLNLAEYLEVGKWHTVSGEGEEVKLTIHCGDDAPLWVRPENNHQARVGEPGLKLPDLKALGKACLERYRAQQLSPTERTIMFPSESRTGHASEHERAEVADLLADDADAAAEQAEREEEEAQEAQEQEQEFGNFDDNFSSTRQYAFIAYVWVKSRLFIVELNASTLQGTPEGQVRGQRWG